MSDSRRPWERRSGGRVTRASDSLQRALGTDLGTSTSSSTYQPYSSSSTSSTALGSPFTYTGSSSTYGGSSSRYNPPSSTSTRPSSPFRYHPTPRPSPNTWTSTTPTFGLLDPPSSAHRMPSLPPRSSTPPPSYLSSSTYQPSLSLSSSTYQPYSSSPYTSSTLTQPRSRSRGRSPPRGLGPYTPPRQTTTRSSRYTPPRRYTPPPPPRAASLLSSTSTYGGYRSGALTRSYGGSTLLGSNASGYDGGAAADTGFWDAIPDRARRSSGSSGDGRWDDPGF